MALTVRIGLLQNLAGVAITDFVFVDLSGIEIGDKQLPDAATTTHAHLVATPVPPIEVANDTGALGVWRPDGKQHAADAIHFVLTEILAGRTPDMSQVTRFGK